MTALLKDKVALVTGAGRGLGQSVARAFAQHGAQVVGVADVQSELDDTARMIEEAGGSIWTQWVDLGQTQQVKDLAIMHSCISCHERRKVLHERFNRLVNAEFRQRMSNLIDQYKSAIEQRKLVYLRQRINELNRRIIECENLWERYAPWDI